MGDLQNDRKHRKKKFFIFIFIFEIPVLENAEVVLSLSHRNPSCQLLIDPQCYIAFGSFISSFWLFSMAIEQ